MILCKRKRPTLGKVIGSTSSARPKWFCQLWCGQCRVLVGLSQMSTPELLPGLTYAHYEVLLPSSIDHVHVPVREKSRETVIQMSQTLVRFFPMGGTRTLRQNQNMVGRGYISWNSRRVSITPRVFHTPTKASQENNQVVKDIQF